MATENDWIDSNIVERLLISGLPFDVRLRPYPFREMSFQDAADYTAKRIYEKNKNIYVSLSGGADSEFVVRVFHRNNIPFTPIIVKTSGNFKELIWAYRVCDKLNLKPVILELNDGEYLKIFYEDVIKKIHGYGIFAVPSIYACRYAKENDGVLIIGEHMIEGEKKDDKDVLRIRPEMNEWDCYNEATVGYEYNIPFYLYTIEICYAMLNAIEDDREPMDMWKCKLYNIDYRPKIEYGFTKEFNKTAANISVSGGMRSANPNHSFGDRFALMELLDLWKIK
jgi:hypothetical protein